jgi:nucleoside-diphosphate-sugar epimerase
MSSQFPGASTRDALVGYTGLVGGNLVTHHNFVAHYNSSNVADLAGQSFDRVVFAAARAEKWRANADPENDRAHIEDLKRALRSFETGYLIMISTVDVYKIPIGVDEATPLSRRGLHAYGAHRLELEEFSREVFDNVLVARLPGLFGPGLKKNVIFDLITGNNLDQIDHRGVFQYYNLARLWADLEVAQARGLEVLNVATEPVSTGEVARHAFGLDFTNEVSGVAPGRYDFRSRHAELFGGWDGYLYSAEEVMAELAGFVATQRANR